MDYAKAYQDAAVAIALCLPEGFNTHWQFVNGWTVNDSFNHDSAGECDPEWDAAGITPGVLQQLGYEFVGAGCFALVLKGDTIPEGYVLKVSLSAYDCGPQYWRYCMDHKGEDYVPEVVAMGHDNKTGWRWCLMRELYCLDSWDSSEFRRCHADMTDVMQWAATIGRCDLHADNVMQDGDGNFIIVDPVSMTRSAMTKVWGGY